MSTVYVAPGEGQHFPMIDGDHVAKVAVQDDCGVRVVGESARFVAVTSGDGAGRFFAGFASAVPADQPVEASMAEILSVTQGHGVAVAATSQPMVE
ncbi:MULTISPECIES: hypothetical protein [Mumia]|uniref:hypothetical protein n=1 Tax=Mumia TaxID=1546255 RepID=UPI001420C879|nr:hypothetical protein [Mumia sp. ZJ430]